MEIIKQPNPNDREHLMDSFKTNQKYPKALKDRVASENGEKKGPSSGTEFQGIRAKGGRGSSLAVTHGGQATHGVCRVLKPLNVLQVSESL